MTHKPLLLLTTLAAAALPVLAEYDTQYREITEPADFYTRRWSPAVEPQLFHVKAAGNYAFYLQYEQPTNRLASLQFRFYRADSGETVRFAFHEYQSGYPSRKPEAVERAAGKVWARVPVTFERPGEYCIAIASAYGAYTGAEKAGWGDRLPRPYLYGSYLTNNPDFDPEHPTPTTDIAEQAPAVPEGFVRATPRRPSVNLNSGVDPMKRLQLTHMECYPYYMDFQALLPLGITMNYGSIPSTEGFEKYDALDTGKPGATREESAAFGKLHPFPMGRSANARGDIGKSFSYSYKPYLDFVLTSTVASVERILDDPAQDRAILNWFSAWEQCGEYDYGETSIAAFRTFLEKKYGSIDALNRAWHCEYASFAEIQPALFDDCLGEKALTNDLERYRARANFIDFRDFNSKAYAAFLGAKSHAIHEADPRRRNMTSAYSNNNLGSIQWIRWRPLSFEDVMTTALAESKTMGWDIYGSDDLIASSFEHFYAMGDEKIWPMIKEGSTHSPDPRMAVRSLWPLFGEGMKGMSLFCIQESPKPELRKFGLSNPDDDMAPRPKLGAYADMFRAATHIENFFTEGRRQPVGKPVALYYSQTCNLFQPRGYGSIFDSAPDTLFRVYELIRANGYPCTIITDRQIQLGERLEAVSAIFFLDAQFIPAETLDALEPWIQRGGHIIADGQSGAFDGHAFPTRRFVELLGIEPVVRERIDEATVAATLAFGYSSQAFEVINQDALWQTQQEYLHQRDSQHPIAKKAGKIMFSGFGSQRVRSVDGETIVLGNNGEVGWHIRSLGKGTASYFAGYLGTLHGGGATQYEWRDAHSDDSPYRFFDALLSFVGACKNAETDLENARDLRISTPLRSENGTLLSTLTSYANHTLPAFRIRTYLPAKEKAPKQVFLTRDGSRSVTPLEFAYNPEKHAIETTLPAGINVFANLLMVLEEAAPLVSIECVDAKRDAARLVDLRPGETLKLRVTVHNPSEAALPAGTLTLRLPEGWFCNKEVVEIAPIPARGASQTVELTIRAPEYCAARRLRPINLLYQAGEQKSMPTVEMLWFQKEGQNEKKGL